MAYYDRPYYRDEPGGPQMFNRLKGASFVTYLLIANVVIFLWDGIMGGSTRGSGAALGPIGYFSYEKAIANLQVWRFLTYQFLHADFFHLLFNMIGLYFFGPMLERWWGSRRFLAYYLLCGASGAAVYVVLMFIPGLLASGPDTALVGASGALFGILVGAAIIAPRQTVMLIFPPIPMQMRTLVLIFLGIAGISVLVGSRNAGGEAAHLGGAALGVVLMRLPGLLDFAGGGMPGPGSTGGAGMFSSGSHERGYAAGPDSAYGGSSNQGGPLGGASGGASGGGGGSNPMAKAWLKRKQKQAQRDRDRRQAEEAEVDRILAKVKDQGIQSLTHKEKRTLQNATDRRRG